ncbi:MAG TPA: DegV family protein [Ktedonobacteraceae bacterium]|nr:DegV family protein [Ktedonobacteraceae bacterium]
MAVRIVTDSTADLPADQAEALGITVVPLTVFFGDEAYLDNVDLDTAGFYEKLQASKDLPRTSQPSPAKFQEAYSKLISEGADGILSVHLSGKLSGTYQSARTASESLTDEERRVPIEVIDSENISAAMSMAVLRASVEARDGLGLEELKTNLLDRLNRTHLLAVLDTLEYVKRGGRIGAASAVLGNMLSVKPIISLKEGEVVTVERPRTRGKAFERIAQLLKESGQIEQIAIAESNEQVGKQLVEALKPVYDDQIPIYKLGPVIGTHTGPGAVALTYIIKK